MTKLTQRILHKLEREKAPKWSPRALKRFDYYFFAIFLCVFGYFILYEPAFITHSWYTVNFLIALVGCFACWSMCGYLEWWIKRKEQGYQLLLDVGNINRQHGPDCGQANEN